MTVLIRRNVALWTEDQFEGFSEEFSVVLRVFGGDSVRESDMHRSGVGMLFGLVIMDSFELRLTTTGVRKKIIQSIFKLSKNL